jgi:heterodisulfide reductase subunit A-like polyferredoxin
MRENAPPATHRPPEEPKGIAVFLCGCRGEVSAKIPLEPLSELAERHPSVRSVDILNECCGQDDMDRMRLILRAGDVDRFIIVGCSIKIMGEKFARLAQEAGIDPFLMEICNINEQCALPHQGQAAQTKAKRLLSISLARCQTLQFAPTYRTNPVERTILIIGNGHSAIVAAREAIALGHEVIIACPRSGLDLGVPADEIIDLDESGLEQLLRSAGDRMNIFNSTTLRDLKGSPGRFTALLRSDRRGSEVTAGAVVVAMDEVLGENPLRSTIDDRCISQHELEEGLRSGLRFPGNIVMLAMDISGASAFDPTSTHEAVHNALFLKGIQPRCNVYIITREVFALGQCEAGYRKAQEQGVKVVRTDRFPEILPGKVIVNDIDLGQKVGIEQELLVFDDNFDLPDLNGTASALKVPLTPEGRFRRPNAKLGPSTTVREGVFLCGTAAERNLGIGPTLEARSAVAKASAMLRSAIVHGGEIAEVDHDRCSACLTCVRTCPYGAPSINVDGKAEVDIDLCQGCGICVGICPSKALQMYSFRDDQIEVQLIAALEGRK